MIVFNAIIITFLCKKLYHNALSYSRSTHYTNGWHMRFPATIMLDLIPLFLIIFLSLEIAYNLLKQAIARGRN